MATRTITSNSITFMDTSDERKLEVSVEANLPTVQIYNPNNESYAPDWTTTNLVLTACVTLDLIDITDKTDNPKPSLKWYQVDDAGKKTELSTTGKQLTIKSNLSGSITYICEATYYKLTANSQMTFTRVAAGANGEAGTTGENGITFQIYGKQGLVLTEDESKTTLAVLAYDGATEITNATYQWYSQDTTSSSSSDTTSSSSSWTTISGATNSTYEISKSNVFKKTTYKCEMTYNGKTYYATATVEDKGDIYDGIINIHDIIKTDDGKCYWVLYTTVYSENGEADVLLGPITTDLSDVDSNENYCYYVDTSSNTVSLKYRQSSSDAWSDAIRSQGHGQKFTYEWETGNEGKVRLISNYDIRVSSNIMCEVSKDYNVIARPSTLLTDTTDPIISSTEPERPVNGQIWIDNSDSSNIVVKVYNETIGRWVATSGKNKTYLSKPDSYKKGDLWVVQTDSDCSYIEEGKTKYYPALTILTAVIDMGSSFNDSDWTVILDSNGLLSHIQGTLTKYENAVKVDENGITITAIDADNNVIGPFSSRFTASKLAFLYDSSKDDGTVVDTETDLEKEQTKLKITTFGIYTPHIEIDKTMQLGGLKFIKEDNGSYSITI